MLQTKGSTPVDNIEEQLQQLDIQHSKLKDNIWSQSYVDALRISEWMAATPLMVWLPTMHRWAMFIFFSPPSSTRDMRRTRSSLLGHLFDTSYMTTSYRWFQDTVLMKNMKFVIILLWPDVLDKTNILRQKRNIKICSTVSFRWIVNYSTLFLPFLIFDVANIRQLLKSWKKLLKMKALAK